MDSVESTVSLAILMTGSNSIINRGDWLILAEKSKNGHSLSHASSTEREISKLCKDAFGVWAIAMPIELGCNRA